MIQCKNKKKGKERKRNEKVYEKNCVLYKQIYKMTKNSKKAKRGGGGGKRRCVFLYWLRKKTIILIKSQKI